MGDGNEEAIRYAGDGIRQLGKMWEGMSHDMSKIAATTKELWLTPAAFMVADPWAGPQVSVDEFRIYEDVHQLLCKQFDEATTEFAELAAVMPKLADAYENTDARRAIDINKIYTKS